MEMTKNGIVYDLMPNGLTVVRLSTTWTPNKRLKIPSSAWNHEVTHIAPNAFQGHDFETVVLPRSIHQIGDYAFADCKSLVGVNFTDRGSCPKYLHIGEKAFYNCESLIAINSIWGSLVLANSAFEGCKNLVLNNLVFKAGERAFAGCEQLRCLHMKCGGELAKNAIDATQEITVMFTVEKFVPGDYENIIKNLEGTNAVICCADDSPMIELVYEGYCVKTTPF